MSKPWDQWLTQTGPYTEERLHPLGNVLFQMSKVDGKWAWKVMRVEPFRVLALGEAFTKRGARKQAAQASIDWATVLNGGTS